MSKIISLDKIGTALCAAGYNRELVDRTIWYLEDRCSSDVSDMVKLAEAWVSRKRCKHCSHLTRDGYLCQHCGADNSI